MYGVGCHGLNNLVGSICESNEIFCSECLMLLKAEGTIVGIRWKHG